MISRRFILCPLNYSHHHACITVSWHRVRLGDEHAIRSRTGAKMAGRVNMVHNSTSSITAAYTHPNMKAGFSNFSLSKSNSHRVHPAMSSVTWSLQNPKSNREVGRNVPVMAVAVHRKGNSVTWIGEVSAYIVLLHLVHTWYKFRCPVPSVTRPECRCTDC